MSEIAHGIDVYYRNDKSIPNIVFFQNKTKKTYPTGYMILETLSDAAAYLLGQKVLNMVQAFPDYNEPLSRNTIINSFMWLYGTVEDDNLPVATELFRGSFDNAITLILRGGNTYQSTGKYLIDCLLLYYEQLQGYAEIVSTLSACFCKEASEPQMILFQRFSDICDSYQSLYTKTLKTNSSFIYPPAETHTIKDFYQLAIFEYCRLIKEGKTIKTCPNCDRLYIPKRKDSIFCPYPSPQNANKTCREIGPQLRRQEKRRTDPNEHMHHNTSCSLYNTIRRLNHSEVQFSPDKYKMDLEKEYKRYWEERKRNE